MKQLQQFAKFSSTAAVALFTLTLTLSSQANFLLRLGEAGFEADLTSQSGATEVLDISSVGDCADISDEDSGSFLRNGALDPLPGDEASTAWSSPERSCFFDFAQDDQTIAVGSALGAMDYVEFWLDGEPRDVEIEGHKKFAYQRLNIGNTDDPAWGGVGTEEGLQIDFSIGTATTYILRASIKTKEDTNSSATIRSQHVAIAYLTSRGGGQVLQSAQATGGPGEPDIVETYVELSPGEYTVIMASGGTLADTEGEENIQPGEASLEYSYAVEMVACDITGTDQDDVLEGTAEDETICALEGNDMVETGGGGDTVFLGPGDDELNTGGTLYNEGISAYGGDGDDVIYGSEDADELYGEAGHDEIAGLGADDLILGGDGDDRIYGGPGDDEIYGEAGFDKIDGEDGDDLIAGGDKKDVIHGGDGNDLIAGGDGDDVLYGDDDDDYITGDNGRDTIDGGSGKDDLLGGKANDIIYGGIGGDVMEGGQGHDIMYGGPNRDRIIGNNGNDVIEGGPGRDRIRGGPGDDVFDLADGEEDFADGGAGFDDASNSDPIIDTLVNVEVEP